MSKDPPPPAPHLRVPKGAWFASIYRLAWDAVTAGLVCVWVVATLWRFEHAPSGPGTQQTLEIADCRNLSADPAQAWSESVLQSCSSRVWDTDEIDLGIDPVQAARQLQTLAMKAETLGFLSLANQADQMMRQQENTATGRGESAPKALHEGSPGDVARRRLIQESSSTALLY